MKQRRSSQSINIYQSFLTEISPEKFWKKILGKNDIEDALKRLDTLTQEEARMATAEIWKTTRSVNDQVAVLIDGAKHSFSLATFMFLLNTDRSDGKEAKAIIQQTASNVDEERRSSSVLSAVYSHDLNILTGNQFRENLQTWLSPPDPSTNQNIARKVHHKGTATWFFEGGIFQEWKLSPSLLWIHGKRTSHCLPLLNHPSHPLHLSWQRDQARVSCGLLFLTLAACINSCCHSSGIVEDIKAQREAGMATMAYFYCDFRDEDKQNCRNLLLSILSQLWDQSDFCCDTLARIYLAHDKGKRKPSDDTLTKCLTEVLSLTAQDPVYLIVDAVDECPNNSGMPTAREEVLDLVKTLVVLSLPKLHICVTSRPEIDIQTALEPLTSLRVSLHNQTGQKKDIIDYVTSVVSSDTMMRRWREEDRNLVIETLSERADGM
jgi:hypothetical protein